MMLTTTVITVELRVSGHLRPRILKELQFVLVKIMKLEPTQHNITRQSASQT